MSGVACWSHRTVTDSLIENENDLLHQSNTARYDSLSAVLCFNEGMNWCEGKNMNPK